MKSHHAGLHASVLASCALAALLPMSVQAQQSKDEAETVSNEIIVTAARRGEQSIQDVPMAISVVTSEDFEVRGLSGMADLARTLPSLALQENGPGSNNIIVRGITAGQVVDASNVLDRSLVSVYLDDTPISLQGQNPDLKIYDLERVEFIRGPQGTLYGASSMSGTIRYITQKPDLRETLGSTEGILSTTDEGGANYSLRGMINVPLVDDKLALRVTAYQGYNQGFMDNPVLGLKNINDETVTQARAALRWQPSEAVTVDASIIYSHLKLDGAVLGYSDWQDYESRFLGPDGGNDDLLIYNLTSEFDLGFANLTTSTSYVDRSVNHDTAADLLTGYLLSIFAGTLQPPLQTESAISNELRNFAQEVRLSSKSGGPFSWTLGAFYENNKRNFQQEVIAPGFDAALSDILGIPYDSVTLGDARVPDSYGYYDYRLRDKQFAVFGEVSYAIAPTLEVTAGLRNFTFTNKFAVDQGGLLGQDPNIVLGDIGKAKADGFNPRAAVTFHATDDNMLFVEASKGFRYGGVNFPVPASICGTDLANLGLSSAPMQFGPDHLWNYAIGSKNKILNGKGTLNVSAYYIDWSNIQSTVRLPSCAYSYIDNGGKIRSRGVELETGVQVDDQLYLSMNASYNDAEFNGGTNNFGANKGDQTPYSNKYIVSTSAEFTIPMPTAEVKMVADYSYRSATHTRFSPADPGYRKVPARHNVNLAVNYVADNWTLGVFANNLTNNVKLLDIKAGTPAFEPGDRVYYARPRTVGVRLKVDY